MTPQLRLRLWISTLAIALQVFSTGISYSGDPTARQLRCSGAFQADPIYDSLQNARLDWKLQALGAARHPLSVSGIPAIAELPPGPKIFVYEHPSYLDPLYLMTLLGPSFNARPIAAEKVVKYWPVSQEFKNYKGLSVPSNPSTEKGRAAMKTLRTEFRKGIENGENFVFAPAGQMRDQAGVENLKNNGLLYNILKDYPHVQVVMVRINGLDSSSMAGNTSSGPISRNILYKTAKFAAKGMVTLGGLLANPAPISIDFEPVTLGSGPIANPQDVSRQDFNQSVNNYFNLDKNGRQRIPRRYPLFKVPFGADRPSQRMDPTTPGSWATEKWVSEKANPQRIEAANLKKNRTIHGAALRHLRKFKNQVVAADPIRGEMTGKTMAVGASLIGKKIAKLAPEKNIATMVPPTLAARVTSLGLGIEGKVEVPINYSLSVDKMIYQLELTEAKHLITSKKFHSKWRRKLSEEDQARWDTYVESKVQLVFLEDLGKQIPTAQKLAAFIKFSNPLGWRSAIKKAERASLSDPAVIIFSSGSTSNPKGIILSHRNVLANLMMATQYIELTENDRLFSFLPGFHSFGYTVGKGLPMTAKQNLRVFDYPDTLDAKGIAANIEKYQTTHIIATPTFAEMIAKRAKKGQLDSIKLLMVGAEKLSDARAKLFAEKFPNATIMEGWGATEISPVGSLGGKNGTVGPPVTRGFGEWGADTILVDYENTNPGQALVIVKEKDTRGLILVKGPHVMDFPYLGTDEDPFVYVRDGVIVDKKNFDPQEFEMLIQSGEIEKYYNTGDIGEWSDINSANPGDPLDLKIVDRLKRFSKIGGEMVPHGAIEDAVNAKFGDQDSSNVCVVVDIGTIEDPQIVALTNRDLTMEDVFSALQEKKLPRVFKPKHVVVMPKQENGKPAELPCLGSGKLDLGRAKQITKEALAL